ncbi:MAG: M13 family metallopeptidase [Spirochaetaceae bacterium]|nr:M13 family metallopeptidase [Spirochaetaceae bacterium]
MKNKKTQAMLIIFSLFLLFGCSNKPKWINTNIDGNILTEKPSLQDDFYQAVNYDDLKNIPLNEGGAAAGGQNEMNKILVQHVVSMAENAEKENESASSQDSEKQNLIALFNMSLDWEKRNKEGTQPVMPIVKKIQSIKTLDELTSSFTDDDVRFIFPLQLNMRNQYNYVYYPAVSLDFMFDRFPEEYSEFYKNMLLKCGFTDDEAEKTVQSAYNFEHQYNAIILENKMSEGKGLYWNQIQAEYKNFPLDIFLTEYGVPNLTYVEMYSNEMKIFDSLYTEENLEAIKALSICKLMSNCSMVLDRESFDYRQSLDERIYGNAPLNTNEEIAVKILNFYAPSFLGKVWSREFCSAEIIADVENIANEILEQYKKQISTWEWLYTGSRYNLVEYLKNTKAIIGYSSFYDYSDLELKENLYDSMNQLSKLEKKIQAKKCYKDVDKYEWFMPPQTYDAYYNKGSINIHAGWIYGNHYDIYTPIEQKYAMLGTVIAHEISHLFSQSSADGDMRRLLNLKDHEQLDKRITFMSEYFNTLEIFDGVNCKGTFCKGEIGADIFAMSTILKMAEEKPDFDYKLFFESYAKTWFSKYPEKTLRILHETDNHPHPFLRVNAIVQHFEEFYKAYGIKRGDGMYLAPENRLQL